MDAGGAFRGEGGGAGLWRRGGPGMAVNRDGAPPRNPAALKDFSESTRQGFEQAADAGDREAEHAKDAGGEVEVVEGDI